MKKLIFMLLIITLTIVLGIVGVCYIHIESEMHYDVLYKNVDGDKIVNITKEEYSDFFGENNVYIVVVMDFTIEEEYIQSELNHRGDTSIETRNEIITAYYENMFSKILEDLELPNDEVRTSKYTPFMWIDITNEDYDTVQDYIYSIYSHSSVSYLEIKEDVLIVNNME